MIWMWDGLIFGWMGLFGVGRADLGMDGLEMNDMDVGWVGWVDL